MADDPAPVVVLDKPAVTPVEGLSPDKAIDVTTPEPTPETVKPEPEAKAVDRSWDELVEAYQKNEQLSAPEWRRIQGALDQQRQQNEETATREERIRNLFPETSKGVVAELGEILNLTPEQVALVEAKVERRLLYGPESLQALAADVLVRPLVEYQARQLFQLTNGDKDVAAFLQSSEATSHTLIQKAIEWGRQNPDTKTAARLKAEGKTEASKEFEEKNPERVSPALGDATPAPGKLTSAQFQAMSLADRAQAWRDKPEEVAAL